MEYTEKEHARRLIIMLEREFPCAAANCPSSQIDNENNYDSCFHGCIPICTNFINLEEKHCPCYVLGNKEAIKRTWIALEEKGYI